MLSIRRHAEGQCSISALLCLILLIMAMAVTGQRSSSLHHEDPYTSLGVHLSPFARAGVSSFVIHECGYLPDGMHTRVQDGRRRVDWNFPGVRSPYWRLYYNHDVGSFVRFSQRLIALDPGHVVIIPEDVLFDCVGEAGASHLWLHFSPSRHSPPPFAQPMALAMTDGLSAAVADLVAAHLAPRSETAQQRLYHSAAALLHASFARLPIALSRDYPERLAVVLAHIDGNPGADLANPCLARLAGMSVEAFIRWFKRYTLTTPAAYVTRSRLRAAARLLVVSEQSIDEIAAQLGFPNRYYLSRVFAAHMGTGPATFRRRHARNVSARPISFNV
jgi:AraC-like DNA-binding protein